MDGQARDYYLRQLRDWKGSADIDTMSRLGDDALWAGLRRDPRPRSRPLRGPDCHRVLPGQQRFFDRAIADFSSAYADQNERDYQALAQAVASGRVVAQTGL